MSGTSSISTRISIRLPNSLVRTLERRINGRRSRWDSVGEYIKERLIYDIERRHGGKRE
jgi:metal-responsive CopG/Arc/MetJ family transcriptional regulator